MKFRDFLNNLDDPLKFYLQYSLKKVGVALDDLKDEEVMQLLTAAVGSHIAEVLNEMYLETEDRKKLIAISA
ncbi:MAG: hypothetical protein JHC20_00020 [Pyrobaculum sp.]|nr:hypothetical protein [Pyrobaculum sp.]